MNTSVYFTIAAVWFVLALICTFVVSLKGVGFAIQLRHTPSRALFILIDALLGIFALGWVVPLVIGLVLKPAV